ncbi:MAG: ATP-grasp domain-containing protein, partial [Betaproteobacteria bacterium]
GLAHPPTTPEPPRDPVGWLAKQAGGCGGTHIRAAASATRATDTYYQRIQPGVPMSALFLADGRGFRIVALNRLLVQARDDRPCVYVGAIGPVADPALERTIAQALAALVPEFGLRGLASLDFIADGAMGAQLLEINPRPSATLQLHARAWPPGLMHAHVEAARGRLPATPADHGDAVRGHATVFAECAGRIDPATAAAWARDAHHHDLPAAGTRVVRGDPVCTVSAEAAGLDAAARLLLARVAAALQRLANLPQPALEETTP